MPGTLTAADVAHIKVGDAVTVVFEDTYGDSLTVSGTARGHSGELFIGTQFIRYEDGRPSYSLRRVIAPEKPTFPAGQDWLGACRLDERGDVWQLRDDGRWYCADPARTDYAGWRGWEPLAGDPVRMTRKVTVLPVGGE